MGESTTVGEVNPPYATFLPYRLLRRLYERGDDRPSESRFNGAVLLADISGFAPLTERLCAEGEHGLEKLRSVLSQAFGQYVRQVHALGGEVVHFAGDAMMACWPADDEELPVVVGRAVACARCLHSTAQQLVEGIPIPDIHTGVGAGPVWLARVGGGTHHWQFILGGQAVRRAAAAESRAARSELVLSDEVVAMGPEAAGTPEVRATTTERLTNAQWQWLRGFVPRFIDAQLEHASADWLAQLRRVNVVFVGIRGLSEDADGALHTFDDLCRALQDELERFSGPAGKMVIGDKGLVFHASFGLPTTSAADDPVRAVEAAIAIENRVRDFGLECAIGVSSGAAVCGPVGTVERLDYMTQGDVIVTAARLMEAAGDRTILCSDATRHAAADRFRFEQVGSIPLKGLSKRTPTYRVAGSKRAEAPLLGRRAELETLREALARARAGHNSVVCVRGEPGIGKSHLAQSLLQHAREVGVSTAAGEAESVQRTTSFLAWRRVFLDLLGLDGEPDPRVTRLAVLEHLRDEKSLKELIPLLKAVLPIEAEDTETTRHLAGQSRADATMRFLSELLAKLTRGAAVILLEDCHWLDSASWRLVEYVARRVPGLLLVLCTRPMAKRPPEFTALQELRDYQQVTLRPLEREDVHGLVWASLGGDSLSEAITDVVYERTGGNPFFAQEYAFLLRDTGEIIRQNGCWTTPHDADELLSVSAPDTVQGMITNRIDHLSSTAEWVVKTASVIGRSFTMRLVRDALPLSVDEASLQSALSSLVEEQVLVPGEGDAYMFRHGVTREVAYSLMLGEQRRELHFAVARSVEATFADDLSSHAAVLAYHWRQADDAEKTLHYSDVAATHALKTGAFKEAVRFLEQCLECGDALGTHTKLDAVRWQRQLAEAWNGLGDLVERGEHATRALSLAGHPIPKGWRVVPNLVTPMVYITFGHLYPKWFELSDSARDKPLHLELARAHAEATAAFYFTSELFEQVFAAVHTLGHAMRLGPSPELCHGYTLVGGSLVQGGYRRLSKSFLGRARSIAEFVRDPSSLGFTHMVNALVLVGRGEWNEVETSIDICQEQCERVGDHLNWCNAQAVRHWLHHYRGQGEEADVVAKALMARAQHTGNVQQEIWAMRCMAMGCLRRNELDDAVRYLKTSMESGALRYDYAVAVQTLGGLAVAYRRLGDRQRAVDFALKALETLRHVRLPTQHSALEGCSGATEILLRAREGGWGWRSEQEQLASSREALRQLRKYQSWYPIGRARYQLWRGLSLWIDGKERAAEKSWRRGLREAQFYGMKRDESLIREHVAERGVDLSTSGG